MAEVNLDMMMVMSAMTAMSSDEAKARTFQEIAAKAQELVAIQNDAQKKLEEAKALAETARQDRLAAESLKVENAARKAALDGETQALASAQMTHQREVEAFGKMRAQIEGDHAEREKAVKAREAAVLETEQQHRARDTDLARRETAVIARESAIERKHKALAEAMAA